MPATIVSIAQSKDPGREIQEAVRLLKAGGLVALPTETLYGVAGVLTHPEARERLGRMRSAEPGGFTLHVPDSSVGAQWIGAPSELALRMMRKLWPGPVSISVRIPQSHQSELARRFSVREQDVFSAGKVTLRCPDVAITREILRQTGDATAMIATRARPEAFSEISESVDYILNGGPPRFGKPSTIIHIDGTHWSIEREGVYDRRIIERLLMTTILFVCSGNTCRSPMAEAIARKLISDKLNVPADRLEERGLSIVSAGTFAMPGQRATREAVDALNALGADLSRHRSRPLSVELLNQADFIFTMGRAHSNAVRAMLPASAEKLATLDPEGDIEDPIGGDLKLYSDLAERMRGLIEKRLTERSIV